MVRTAEHVKSMSDAPIILAMANPIPEIMPDVAKAAGAAVIGTGRSDFPNQVNNVLAFPRVAGTPKSKGLSHLKKMAGTGFEPATSRL